ncbi:hypothetical protein [Leisingera sp. JC1]|uniref:hypothetical protein n=1 Tax=Leisingera sp. JC1 TaxID=1855282 RepID=UPI000802D693|nr:hypothetical protein [Leisingera sp. JC1]OBY27530.1 hypothetical protein A9D60_14945 [Leisingera sp. JC1]
MAVTDHTPPQISAMPGARALGAISRQEPLRLRFQANWKVRVMMFRLLGAAMILSSAGLWLVQGAGADPELNLIRFGVSIAFLLAGVVLMTAHEPAARPEACFDPVRRELRVLKHDAQGSPRTVLRRSYDSLGAARLTGNAVQLFEDDGSLLIELPLDSAATRGQLRDQLSGAVKILT